MNSVHLVSADCRTLFSRWMFQRITSFIKTAGAKSSIYFRGAEFAGRNAPLDAQRSRNRMLTRKSPVAERGNVT